jgi:membrane-bound serine protease (ClpP class)
MWRHLLLVTPLVIAALFVVLPVAMATPIAVVVAVVAALIAYQGARALRQPAMTGVEAMVGSPGETVSELNPTGLVRIGGELWRAEAREPIGQGTRVQVLEVQGTKVRVRPWSS